MARGTAAGEPVVSQANSSAFRDGYDRTFGQREPQRGKWVQDPTTGELIDAASYVPPVEAKDAPVMVGRFYEGVPSPIDGTVFQSRRQHRDHMRRHGVTAASDFKAEWAKAKEKRDRIKNGERAPIKGLREALERKFYQIQKP